jgi:hypothetical protein
VIAEPPFDVGVLQEILRVVCVATIPLITGSDGATTVEAAAVTVKLVPTFAAENVLSDALIVIIVHVPATLAVTTVPETVQVDVVSEV